MSDDSAGDLGNPDDDSSEPDEREGEDFMEVENGHEDQHHQQHHQAQQHFIPPNPRDVPPNDAAAAAAAQRKAQAAENAKQGTFPGCDGGRYRTRFDRSKVDFDETCAFDVNRLRKLYMDILHLKTQYPGASQGLVAGLLDILHNWTVSKESEGGRVATSFCA